MAHGSGETPWLERGVGQSVEDSDPVAASAAALLSIAITFKRVVDILEPVGHAILAEIEKEKAEAKKGRK